MDKKKLAILIAAIFTAALVLTGCGIAQRGQTQSDGQEAGQEEAAASAAAEAERKAEEAKQEAQKRAQEAREAREAESRASEDASEEANSSEGSGEGSGRQEEVTLEMEGEPETEFSGSCAVGGREGESVAGRVPRTFEYQTDGRKLKCEIRNESGGELKVVLVSGNDRSVQSIYARGATMELTYSDNALSSTTSSSSSGGGGSGSSQSVSSSSSSQSSHQSGGGSSHQSSSQSSRQVVSSE